MESKDTNEKQPVGDKKTREKFQQDTSDDDQYVDNLPKKNLWEKFVDFLAGK